MLAVAVCAPGRMRARWAVAVAGGVAAEAVVAAAAAAAAVVLAAAVAVAAEPNEYYRSFFGDTLHPKGSSSF